MKTIAILGLGIILLGMGLWWSVSGGAELEEDEPELVVLDPDDPGAMGMRGAGGAPPEEGDSAVEESGGDDDEEAPGAASIQEVMGVDDDVELMSAEEGSAEGMGLVDVGGEGDGEEEEEVVVGPREWAAEPDDVDVEALEEQVLESEMAQEELLVLREDRRAAISVGRQVVRECRGAHKRDMDELAPVDRQHVAESVGDVAVGFEMRTGGGDGVIEDVELLLRQGARGVGFEACVVQELEGQVFEAGGDGGELWVEFVDQVE